MPEEQKRQAEKISAEMNKLTEQMICIVSLLEETP